ncbi:Hpt domain-containing protein [Neptuniibacter halophilus]|uniref:Hpt domain-containing protein n=1 Tax=Neptuniibacter halophilus TaxID=651666 RepID=UPI002573A76D|nr:Hpt domain-containing protein [Neptuniibacter halophilus]
MSIDLSQFIATFMEESYEGLEVMESSLLNLDSADEETINTIFRAAHSIKGGAGTFGFSEVADFTHVVETLLDELRSGKQSITPPLVNLLLESVDCMKMLLEATQEGPEADADVIAQVRQRLEQALGAEGVAETPDETPMPVETSDGTSGKGYWEIEFLPHADLLQAGHEPIFMFQTLAESGRLEVQVNPEKLPKLSKLNPEQIHLNWTLRLHSDCDEAEIREVFEWVEDECELNIRRCSETALTEAPAAGQSGQVSGWRISFRPKPSLLETGNEPAYMFQALAELGRLVVSPVAQALPDLTELDPEKIYLSWELEIYSDCDREEVAEVFEWVEDECDLQIEALQSPIEPVAEEAAPVQAAAQAEPVSSPQTCRSGQTGCGRCR